MKKLLVFLIVFYNIQLYGSENNITKIEQFPGGYTVTINGKNKIIGKNTLQTLLSNSQQSTITQNKDTIIKLLQKDTVTIVSEQYWEALNQAWRELRMTDKKLKPEFNNSKTHFFILERLGSKGHKRGLKLH